MRKWIIFMAVALLSSVSWGAFGMDTPTTLDTSWNFIQISVDTADGEPAGTSYDKWVVEITDDTTSDWTRIDSITSSPTNPDTSLLNEIKLTATFGSVFGLTIYARVIGTDDATLDTSAILTVHTLAAPTGFKALDAGVSYSRFINNYTDVPNSFKREDYALFDMNFTYNQSDQAFYSDTILIRPEYKSMRLWAKLFGFDFQRTFDSTSFFIYTGRGGEFIAIDTLISLDIDTVTTDKNYPLQSLGVVANDTMNSELATLKDWGELLYFMLDVSDSSASAGDTMDLDRRYMWARAQFFK